MSKYYQYVKRGDSVQTDSLLWKNLLPELAYFPDAVEEFDFQSNGVDYFSAQEFDFFSNDQEEKVQTNFTDESTPEIFSINVKSPIDISEGDPLKMGSFLYLSTLFANIQIDQDRLLQRAKKISINPPSGKFEQVKSGETFSVNYKAFNYINHLKNIYFDSPHIVSFLEKFETNVFNPDPEQLFAAGDIVQQLKRMTAQEYELFNKLRVISEINDSFSVQIAGFNSRKQEIYQIVNRSWSVSERVIKLHELLTGRTDHVLLMALTLNLSQEEANSVVSVYQKVYKEPLANRIIASYNIYFGPNQFTYIYQLFSNLYLNAKTQNFDSVVNTDKPYFIVEPQANEIAEGKRIKFEFNPVSLNLSKLSFSWFVSFDQDGLLMYELQQRGVKPDLLYNPSKEKSFEAIFFFPGKHEIICRVEDRSGSIPIVTHYVYQQQIISAYQAIKNQQQEALSRQTSYEGDYLQGLINSSRLRIFAKEKGFLSETLFQAIKSASVELLGQEKEAAEGKTSFTINKLRVTDFFEKAALLLLPFQTITEVSSYDFSKTVYNSDYTVTDELHRYTKSILSNANTADEWKKVRNLFTSYLNGIDKYLAFKLKEKGYQTESAQLAFWSGLSLELDKLKAEHPDAQKVKALFYPKEYIKNEENNDLEPNQVPGIPFFFYTYYNETEKEWVLKDITNPTQIKSNVKSGTKETYPHRELFAQLDSNLRFPEGILFYETPDRIRNTVYTHNRATLSDWLARIGMVTGAFMLAAFTMGAAVPVELAVLTSGLIISSATLKYLDYREQGMQNTTYAYIELLNIVGALLPLASLSARLVISSSLEVGNTVALQTLKNWYVVPTILGLGTDAAIITLLAEEGWNEFTAVNQNTKIAPAEKQMMLARITANLLLQGMLAVISVKGAVKQMASLKPGTDIYLDKDFAGETSMRPLFDIDSLIAKMQERGMPPHAAEDAEYLLTDKSTIPVEIQQRIHADIVGAVYNEKAPADASARCIATIRKKLKNEGYTKLDEPLAELRALNRLIYFNEMQANSVPYISYKPKSNLQDLELAPGISCKITPLTEIDALYLTRNNTMRIEEVKATMRALYDKSILKSEKATQLDNLIAWRKLEENGLPREVIIRVEADSELNALFSIIDKKDKIPLIAKLAENSVDVYVGAQWLSAAEMKIYSEIFKSKKKLDQLPTNFYFDINTLTGLRNTFNSIK
jgi:hypothetical protein